VRAIGLTLFRLAGGFVFDKFAVKNTILISVSIFSVFTFLSGLSHNLTMLMIARILDGSGVGMLQPAIVAFLGDILPEKRG
ncbi:MFS transporter, partial [Heyndrickxia faecalis]|uniref:MFS transporter n=1 Tax=Heyndrickxia faecalis TaxID=2824910 RepID=UPI0032EF9D5D